MHEPATTRHTTHGGSMSTAEIKARIETMFTHPHPAPTEEMPR